MGCILCGYCAPKERQSEHTHVYIYIYIHTYICIYVVCLSLSVSLSLSLSLRLCQCTGSMERCQHILLSGAPDLVARAPLARPAWTHGWVSELEGSKSEGMRGPIREAFKSP